MDGRESVGLEGCRLFGIKGAKRIHFIGIGGISMCGLAEIVRNMGYAVSGSDLRSTEITRRLQDSGVTVWHGHSPEHVAGADIAVYTAAAKEDNPERIEAGRLGIPAVERAVLLGELMKLYKCNIAVSGTHGKTTTTSMISMILMEAGLDPTIHVGGELDCIGGTVRIGGNGYFVTEADEYVESFLKFHPTLAVVLNVEADHLDYYRDVGHIRDSFGKFAELVPEGGHLVVCADDPGAMSVASRKGLKCDVVTYGISAHETVWRAANIEFSKNGCASFDVYSRGEKLCGVSLRIPGIHNVSNSLAAICACSLVGCSPRVSAAALSEYAGTHRRFEKKGVLSGTQIIDDYAHHPTEIRATLRAAANTEANRVLCIFQPHTYTRTKALLSQFAEAFDEADRVIVTDIYAAREKDTGEINSGMLADRLRQRGIDALYMKGFEEIAEYIRQNAKPGDMVITMGAGDVHRIGEMLLDGAAT